MEKSFQCPFCNNYFPLTNDTYSEREVASNIFQDKVEREGFPGHYSYLPNDECLIGFFCCPNCKKTSIKLKGLGSQVSDLAIDLVPSSQAKILPEYIPQVLKTDYEEACKIVKLSPKASATLSRRCLQGMIRDYWNIADKKNLFSEIEAIKNDVTPQVKKVLDSVRQIGNIGAHMEKDINLIIDIDPNEAQQLINLIEYLIEQWYIQRHESELMLASIVDINNAKQNERRNQ